MIEVILGPEYDFELFSRLTTEIEALGGSIGGQEWTLGGSQELTVFHITLPEGELEAVAETYVGLSLRGELSLVQQLGRRMLPNWSLDLLVAR
ncbi:hypothetical protein [Oryzomicrobium sp.]|uniref:hypothetical protein n=1 Tax=Oryzomicrobium sp. TaxID=1911578 RepID=UPI002FE3F168